MQDQEKTIIYIGFIGALIALGKLLKSDETLSLRLVIGRMITGAAVSLIAGVGLIDIPDMPPLATIGLASTLGILGDQFLEFWIKEKLNN